MQFPLGRVESSLLGLVLGHQPRSLLLLLWLLVSVHVSSAQSLTATWARGREGKGFVPLRPERFMNGRTCM